MQIARKNINNNNNNNVSNFICSNWIIALRACFALTTRCVEAQAEAVALGVAKHKVKVLKTNTKWWKSQIKHWQNGAQNGVSCRKNTRSNDWWLRWNRKNKILHTKCKLNSNWQKVHAVFSSFSLSLPHFLSLLIIRSASWNI